MNDEERLVARTLAGDEDAFACLLGPHRQAMMNLAYRLTSSREAAEEICQEALIKIYKYLPKYQTGRSFRNWIFKITTNAAYDYLRRSKREEDIITSRKFSAPLTEASAEQGLENREIGRRIKACLRHLTPRERIIFVLRDVEGFSVQETAGLLRSSSMAVRTHLSRARSKIRLHWPHILPTSIKEECP